MGATPGVPSIERLAAHGWYGATSSRFLSITTRGWYPSVDTPGSTIAKVLAHPTRYDDSWMPYIAIGQSGDDCEWGLVNEIYRKKADIVVVRNTYFARATFGQDEPTGDGYGILEIGLFDAIEEGNMGARWVLQTANEKDNIDPLVVECAVTILRG